MVVYHADDNALGCTSYCSPNDTCTVWYAVDLTSTKKRLKFPKIQCWNIVATVVNK